MILNRSISNARVETCRLVLAGFVLLNVLILSLMPAGFMPEFNADGKVAIVICSGLGEKTIYVDADAAPDHPHDNPSHDDQSAPNTCAYYLAQGYALTTPGVGLAGPVAFEITNFAAMRDHNAEILRASRPAVRGPPAFMLS